MNEQQKAEFTSLMADAFYDRFTKDSLSATQLMKMILTAHLKTTDEENFIRSNLDARGKSDLHLGLNDKELMSAYSEAGRSIIAILRKEITQTPNLTFKQTSEISSILHDSEEILNESRILQEIKLLPIEGTDQTRLSLTSTPSNNFLIVIHEDENGSFHIGGKNADKEVIEKIIFQNGTEISIFSTSKENNEIKYSDNPDGKQLFIGTRTLGRLNYSNNKNNYGTYLGEFSRSKFNNFGTLRFNNGDYCLSGSFESGILNGSAIFSYNNGAFIFGEFKDNQLVDGQFTVIAPSGKHLSYELQNKSAETPVATLTRVKSDEISSKTEVVIETTKTAISRPIPFDTLAEILYPELLTRESDKRSTELQRNKLEESGAEEYPIYEYTFCVKREKEQYLISKVSNGFFGGNSFYMGELRQSELGRFEKYGLGLYSFDDSNLYEDYEGEFYRDQFDGIGTLNLTNGEKYLGGFRDGKMDGIGLFSYTNGASIFGGDASSNLFALQGSTSIFGRFEENRLADGQFTVETLSREHLTFQLRTISENEVAICKIDASGRCSPEVEITLKPKSENISSPIDPENLKKILVLEIGQEPAIVTNENQSEKEVLEEEVIVTKTPTLTPRRPDTTKYQQSPRKPLIGDKAPLENRVKSNETSTHQLSVASVENTTSRKTKLELPKQEAVDSLTESTKRTKKDPADSTTFKIAASLVLGIPANKFRLTSSEKTAEPSSQTNNQNNTR